MVTPEILRWTKSADVLVFGKGYHGPRQVVPTSYLIPSTKSWLRAWCKLSVEVYTEHWPSRLLGIGSVHMYPPARISVAAMRRAARRAMGMVSALRGQKGHR